MSPATSATIGSNVIAHGYSAAGTTDGIMVPSAAEQAEMRARAEGRTPPRPRVDDSDSAGVRTYGVERRPGAKTIRPEHLSLRRSDAVGAILKADMLAEQFRREQEMDHQRRNGTAAGMRLNLAQRQRDFGQNESYDIITLAGAGGQTGRDEITPSHPPAPIDAAGQSSRSQHAREFAWSGTGGDGYAEKLAHHRSNARSARGTQHSHHESSLDNTFHP